MFPFCVEWSSEMLEPMAVLLVAGLTWLFQVLGPR